MCVCVSVQSQLAIRALNCNVLLSHNDYYGRSQRAAIETIFDSDHLHTSIASIDTKGGTISSSFYCAQFTRRYKSGIIDRN